MPQPAATALSRRQFLAMGVIFPALQLAPRGVSPTPPAYLTYDQVEPILAAAKLALPAELAGLSADQRRSAWPRWVETRDREIRSRLLQGEEDTLVNFVLFGVSFTDQPRVTADAAVNPDAAEQSIAVRVQHFMAGIATPGNNERLVLLRRLLTALGYGAATAAEKERLSRYLTENISRYLAEQQQYGRALDAARLNDTTSPFSSTSELYRNRGLSIDTDFRPNFAIEQTLLELRRRGALRSVRRAAIIGPGLDFADKDSGFDFYPLQTLQPFALIDSLVRLELSEIASLHVSVFDISSQTLDHIAEANRLAVAGRAYTLQLVMDPTRGWSSEVVDYWRRLGDRIGDETKPLQPPPQIQNMEQRAVRIQPEVVGTLAPQSLNLVLQHLKLPVGQQYDLIVATNVFVYYDAFEQALSLLNIDAMMAPGALFLSNDITRNFPGVRLSAIGNLEVEYSRGQGDRIQMYSKSPFAPQLPPR